MSDSDGASAASAVALAGAKGGRTAGARVALIGPPNSGKTTLFNRLTGLRQKVANFPGVTVERHTGVAVLADGREVPIIDLPGLYGLSPRSEDEQIAYDVLTGRRGDTGKPRASRLRRKPYFS